MTRARVASLVALSDRGLPAWRARAVAEELASLLAATAGIDRPLRDRALQAIAVLAPSLRVPPPPPALEPGAAYVLLAGPLGGETAVVRVRREGRAGAIGGDLPREVEDAVRIALDGWIHALAEAGCGLPGALETGAAIELDRDPIHVEGASLGLAVVIAATSGQLGRAVPPDVAASAVVHANGTLGAVESLGAKLEALRRDHPHVTRVIVAREQTVDDAWVVGSAIEIVRARAVGEALEAIGLSIDRARFVRPSRERLRALSASFESATVPDWSRERWRELSAQAAYVAECFGGGTVEGAAAYGWAALFAIHAGDDRRSRRLRALVPPGAIDALPPRTRIGFLVAEAVGHVGEDDLGRAIASGTEAVRLLGDLHPADRVVLLGRTHGALGRVLLRAGRVEEGLEHYRIAAEHHRRHVPEALPRSLCHLATALRKLGRNEEAWACLVEARERNEPLLLESDRAATTRMFMRLEEGYVLLELGEPARAVHALELCADAQRDDADWPRIGAIAALVRAHLESGRPDLAERALETCVRVCASAEVPPRLARAAAVGVARALRIVDCAAETAPWSARAPELRELLERIGVDVRRPEDGEVY